MNPRVNHVQYVTDYRLELGFTDGLRKDIDFRDKVVGRGGVFRTLADPVLYSLATGRPIETLQLA